MKMTTKRKLQKGRPGKRRLTLRKSELRKRRMRWKGGLKEDEYVKKDY